jgi:hypothetical protein
MKRKLYTLAILLSIAIAGNCQFIPQDINYPDPANYSHWPDWMSIVDASTVWLGTARYHSNGTQATYTYAVHTTDGGNTWQFDSIPVPGQPVIMSLSAVDANTCFYDFSNIDWSNSAIWKTSDGGATWAKKTTTQFTGTAAFCDFYHAFDANEGVAVGDPTQGYFEIQRTTDGGNTWTRVASSLIPPPLSGEWGLANIYSYFGDNVWFAATWQDGVNTWATRCYKSIDRGQHWTVSPHIASLGNVEMDFASAQKGVLLDPNSSTGTKYFYVTSDGGDTWSKDSLPGNDLLILGVSHVGGFDGGFMMGLWESPYLQSTLVFTPDFFTTTVIIDSNLAANPYGVHFKDASTGWISGLGADTNTILKYNGLLTSISNAAKSVKLTIIPNPTSTEALVKLPVLNEQGDLRLMIYDASGKLCENRPAGSTTGWTKIDASAYKSGVYVLQVVSGDRMIASTKWVVKH